MWNANSDEEWHLTLRSHLDSVTTRLIQQAIHGGHADIEECSVEESAPQESSLSRQ